MSLISRNLWINNHGQGWDDTCKVSPWLAIIQIGSGFNQISSLESPSTHSRLDCITHGCNSLPTSFSEMNQLIFHKKLIVCLWINNHFNYIPMWTLHHVVCCSLLALVFCLIHSAIGSHTVCEVPSPLLGHVLSSLDVSNVIMISSPAPATVRSYYHYHV